MHCNTHTYQHAQAARLTTLQPTSNRKEARSGQADLRLIGSGRPSSRRLLPPLHLKFPPSISINNRWRSPRSVFLGACYDWLLALLQPMSSCNTHTLPPPTRDAFQGTLPHLHTPPHSTLTKRRTGATASASPATRRRSRYPCVYTRVSQFPFSPLCVLTLSKPPNTLPNPLFSMKPCPAGTARSASPAP